MKLLKLIPAAAIVLTAFMPLEGKTERICMYNNAAFAIEKMFMEQKYQVMLLIPLKNYINLNLIKLLRFEPYIIFFISLISKLDLSINFKV